MRLMITIPQKAANDPGWAEKLARTLAVLVDDGHSVAVVLGQTCSLDGSICECSCNSNEIGRRSAARAESPTTSEITTLSATGRRLVVAMAKVGLTGIVFCASDGGLTRARKIYKDANHAIATIEIANSTSRWLEIVTNNKGIPIICNLYVCECGKGLLIEPNMLAAHCALGWKASLLVYLVEDDGIRAANGETIRWLDIQSSELLTKNGALTTETKDRLIASTTAIKRGVARVRLLPLSEINSLASFYFEAVVHGTEVVLSR
jgi:acetylglutamate kinase